MGPGFPNLLSHPLLLVAGYVMGAIATLMVDSLAIRGTPNFWEAMDRKTIGIVIGWPAFLIGFGVGLCVRFFTSLSKR